MSAPPTSVVVLSYDRPALLELALQSLDRQTLTPFDIVVVDNPSPSSPEVRKVVAAHPAATLVSCDENLGFTGGMNRGLAEVRGEYVYLSEDDIELAPDCLEQLAAHLARHPETALAGPVMWNRHARTIRCAGGDFAFASVFHMSVAGVGDQTVTSLEPFHTGFLPGAMIMARTAELRALRGFHGAFFMYREDIELCARVRASGRYIDTVPSAGVHHHEPPDAPEPPVLSYHKHKNLGALYLLHAPLLVLPFFFFRYVVLDGARRAVGRSSQFGAWLSAWWWVARHSPQLLAQRWGLYRH